MIAYAPILDTQIPAFLVEKNTSDNFYYPTDVTVNFTHNLAVAYSDVKGVILRMKSLVPQNGELKNTFLCESWIEITDISQLKSGSLVFEQFHSLGSTDNLYIRYVKPGSYYKIQIAYVTAWKKQGGQIVGTEEVGTWSTIGIARSISENTELSIMGLSKEDVNDDIQTYKGVYTSSTSNEIVYRYKFDLLTIPEVEGEPEQLLETSGWQFPAGEEMIFSHSQWLTAFISYKIRLTVSTINGYETDVEYTISRQTPYPNLQENLILTANQDSPEAKENGYVDIYLENNYTSLGNINTALSTAKGVLLRQKVGDLITTWDELAKFTLYQNSSLNDFSWKDFSVAHGETYIYAIRFYNVTDGKTIWSDMIKTTDKLPTSNINFDDKERSPVTVVFENMYLGDGDKQLCIRLNPKVSSFKETILEQKTDTIGGKYPYFFRNATVGYKEIPISGLISYWMDKDGYFLGMPNNNSNKTVLNAAEVFLGFNSNQERFYTPDALSSKAYRTTNLTNENFSAEKKFKIEVLKWLNNGKPKLFRSAAEGNYVVRLMNVSLSPDDKLGRMLHTFSATGYETMSTNIAEMKQEKNNIVSFPRWRHSLETPSTREYVTEQFISENSLNPIVSEVQPATYYLRQRTLSSLMSETDYALIEKKQNTQWHDIIFKDGVETLTIWCANEHDEFIKDEKYLKTLTKNDNQISVADLPKKFAVPIKECKAVLQHQAVSKQGQNAFDGLVRTANKYLFSIEENNTCSTNPEDLLYKQSIKRMYNLTITPVIGQKKEDAWVLIEYEDMTSETIYLKDGKQRIFKDIDDIRRIEKGKGIRLDIYALIQPNVSSALDAFILDTSTLGV